MKKFILVLSVFLYMPMLHAEENAILVNSDRADIQYSKLILKKMFLGRYTVNEAGNTVSPCYLDAVVVRKSLYTITNKTSAKFRSYWNKKLFSGSGSPPKSFNNIENLFQYLNDNVNGVCLATMPTKLPKGISRLRITDKD